MVRSFPENTEGTQNYKCLEECYALALHSSAEYAVELEPQATLDFQRYVRTLAERATAGPTPEDLRSLQASFRGELREYRDKSRLYLRRLRGELAGATQAMQTFADSVLSNGEGVRHRVRKALKNVEDAAVSGDLERIRYCIQETLLEVERSYEDQSKANALVTAELQHEIRLLHSEREADRRLAWTDAASGAWIKKKIDDRLDSLLSAKDAFYVMVLMVKSLGRLRTQCGMGVVDKALQHMVKRFQGILGEEGLIARVGEDQFAAVVEVDSSATQVIAQRVTEELSSRYSVQNNGIAQSIELRVLCGIVGRPRGSDAAEFLQKLQHMMGTADTSATAGIQP